MPDPKPKKVLAVSSGGGHWVQLLRLRPAFEGCVVTYATVQAGYATQVPGERFLVIPDSTRWNKLRMLRTIATLFLVVLRVRPDVIVSTGAAPGYFAIQIGRLFGARTVWIDSIANAEELSLSGKKAGKCADLWLTQWAHLAHPEGPQFRGSVL